MKQIRKADMLKKGTSSGLVCASSSCLTPSHPSVYALALSLCTTPLFSRLPAFFTARRARGPHSRRARLARKRVDQHAVDRQVALWVVLASCQAANHH